MAVAEVAYQWGGYSAKEHINKSIEVIYNREDDIIELVEKKFNGWNNDLPF